MLIFSTFHHLRINVIFMIVNIIFICLVQVCNDIELQAVGLQFEPYLWLLCGVTWDSSQTVVEIKLLRTSALHLYPADNPSHFLPPKSSVLL